jgi:tRNA nucleotidyltransferase/poly(A) polymerase
MASLPDGKFAKCVNDLFLSGMLQHIYPEIDKLKYFQHSSFYHPEGINVLTHVIKSLETYKGNDPFQNFSLLFHDIGKSESYLYKEDKGHTYHAHDQIGNEMIKKLSVKYKWPNDLRDIVSYCALEHMKYFCIDEMKNSKVLKLLSSPYWKYLKETSRCDAFCRCVNERMKITTEAEWNKIEEKLNNMKTSGIDLDYLKDIKSVVNGDYIMKMKGIDKPSKEVGRILKIVTDKIFDKKLTLNDMTVIDDLIKSVN